MTYSEFVNAFINTVADSGYTFREKIPAEALVNLMNGLRIVDVTGRFPQDPSVKACCK